MSDKKVKREDFLIKLIGTLFVRVYTYLHAYDFVYLSQSVRHKHVQSANKKLMK